MQRTVLFYKKACWRAVRDKGVSTPPATCPLPRGGRVNHCIWLKLIDKRVRDDRDARVATQLQPNTRVSSFGHFDPVACSQPPLNLADTGVICS
jgi:hypothetical protein